MKIASPGDVIPFAPFDQLDKPEEARIRYRFRVPSVVDQARFERGVAEDGGREWSWREVLAALKDGIRALLPDEADPERISVLAELDAVAAEITEVATALAAGGLEADDETRGVLIDRWRAAFHSPRLAELEALTAPYYPRLAAMQADNRLFNQIRGTTACRLFLVGWENMPGKIRRGLKGADEATLRQIPEHHRAAIGAWCGALFGPTETERKN